MEFCEICIKIVNISRHQVISDFAPDLGTLSAKDRDQLQEFLSCDNQLARLAIHKNVSWNAFGEISERIKRTIRDKGFVGAKF